MKAEKIRIKSLKLALKYIGERTSLYRPEEAIEIAGLYENWIKQTDVKKEATSNESEVRK